MFNFKSMYPDCGGSSSGGSSSQSTHDRGRTSRLLPAPIISAADMGRSAPRAPAPSTAGYYGTISVHH
eukprot:2524764-Rhodomonas_salina.1